MMIFARVVQIAIAATGFTCSTAANKLRFILSDSQCLRESNQGFLFFFFFGCFYFRMRGNLLSETFVVENIRCKHRQIMQYLIFELRSRIAPMESRGRPAEIFTYLKTRLL